MAAPRTPASQARFSPCLGFRIGNSGIPSPDSGNKGPTPISVVSGLQESQLCWVPNTRFLSGAFLPTSRMSGSVDQSAQRSVTEGGARMPRRQRGGALPWGTGALLQTRARWQENGAPQKAPLIPSPTCPCPLACALPWIWAVTQGPGSGLRLGRGGRENGGLDIWLTLQLLAFILLGLVFFQQAGQHGRGGLGAGRARPPPAPGTGTSCSAPAGPGVT